MSSPSKEPQTALGDRAHLAGVVVNSSLAVMKLSAGLWTGSPSLTADGWHSLSDLVTNAVGWVSFRFSLRPPDEDHHYGHGKAEAAAGLFIGLVLLVGGLLLGVRSTLGERLPVYQDLSGWLAVSVALVSMGSNEWLYRFTRHAAEELRSPNLMALARDNRSDVLTAVLVVVGVLASLASVPGVEMGATLLISLAIVAMGFQSLRESLDVLMDRVDDQELAESVRDIAAEVERVELVEELRIHPLGNRLRVDLEIQVDGLLSVRQGHTIAHRVEDRVRAKHPAINEVLVHVNPAAE